MVPPGIHLPEAAARSQSERNPLPTRLPSDARLIPHQAPARTPEAGRPEYCRRPMVTPAGSPYPAC